MTDPNCPGTSDRLPQARDGVRALADSDTGRFALRTLTGEYVLDLTNRRVARHPVTLSSGTRSLTLTFDVDGTWLNLIELTECATGEPMRAVLLIDGVPQPLRSSPVQTIVALPERT